MKNKKDVIIVTIVMFILLVLGIVGMIYSNQNKNTTPNIPEVSSLQNNEITQEIAKQKLSLISNQISLNNLKNLFILENEEITNYDLIMNKYFNSSSLTQWEKQKNDFIQKEESDIKYIEADEGEYCSKGNLQEDIKQEIKVISFEENKIIGEVNKTINCGEETINLKQSLTLEKVGNDFIITSYQEIKE